MKLCGRNKFEVAASGGATSSPPSELERLQQLAIAGSEPPQETDPEYW